MQFIWSLIDLMVNTTNNDQQLFVRPGEQEMPTLRLVLALDS